MTDQDVALTYREMLKISNKRISATQEKEEFTATERELSKFSCACNPSSQVVRQKKKELKANLSYIASSSQPGPYNPLPQQINITATKTKPQEQSSESLFKSASFELTFVGCLGQDQFPRVSAQKQDLHLKCAHRGISPRFRTSFQNKVN